MENENKVVKTRAKKQVIEEPIVNEESIVTDVTETLEYNGYVSIPDYCIAYGRVKPNGNSDAVRIFHNKQELLIDGYQNTGYYIWLHDSRGFWIESTQCVYNVSNITEM